MGGGLSPTGAVLALVTKAGSVCCLNPKCLHCSLGPHLRQGPPALSAPASQWALPRSIVLGLCFSVFSRPESSMGLGTSGLHLPALLCLPWLLLSITGGEALGGASKEVGSRSPSHPTI